jgi:hypothetical protein
MRHTILTNGTILCTAVLGVLTGCVGYEREPRPAVVYTQPAPVYVESPVQDEYVYYPSYQVYYNSRRREYVYQNGRSWVSRSAPPRVSPRVLATSPSVRLDFHDSPASHHATVVKQYPKHWAPPGGNSNRGEGNDGREQGHEGRR